MLNASGYVVAQRKASVATKVTGRLEYLGVEEGTRVKKGEVLARLEDDDAVAARNRTRANLEAARAVLRRVEAELENARLDFERKSALKDRLVISKAEFDVARAGYLAAKAAVSAQEASVRAAVAALKESEVLIDYTKIKAPFDGVVLTKNADIGDIIAPLGAAANAQAAVVTMADMNSLQVEVDVSESGIREIKVGQPAVIQLDAFPNERYKGRVHMVVPTADRTKASILVKVAFSEKDPRILPEMSAKAAFLSREIGVAEDRPVKVVPLSAVIRENGATYVFVIEKNKAFRRRFEPGEILGDRVEVKEGLELGQDIILSPPESLKDGMSVDVSEE